MGQSTDQRMNPRVRMLRIIDACQSIIDDTASWNDAHPQETPLDCEADRIVRAAAGRCLELFDNRRWDEFSEAYDELLQATRSWDLGERGARPEA